MRGFICWFGGIAMPLSALLLFLYLVVSLFAFLNGISSRNNTCLKKPVNAEIILPSYRLGCWLRGVRGEQYYWRNDIKEID